MKKAPTTIRKRTSSPKESHGGDSPSQLIDARINELDDWRGETLARVRMLIKQADPEVVEEVKWRKLAGGRLVVTINPASRRKRPVEFQLPDDLPRAFPRELLVPWPRMPGRSAAG
jgi:hypothetical protein